MVQRFDPYGQTTNLKAARATFRLFLLRQHFLLILQRAAVRSFLANARKGIDSMTLLIKMQDLLPIAAQIDLSTANGSGVFEPSGTFEVVDMNSAEGNEDTHVHVAYRSLAKPVAAISCCFHSFRYATRLAIRSRGLTPSGTQTHKDWRPTGWPRRASSRRSTDCG
jgi:hypothetical protein